jgi:hypothetical protein
MIPNLTDLFGTLASIATAFGIFLGIYQIKLSRDQDKTQFEDSSAKEYRDIAAQIPTKAFFGEELSKDEYENALQSFYRYLDLSNEQIHLRRNNRITLKTWNEWKGGIKSNLTKYPAFSRAWEKIKKSSGDFQELRQLELNDFEGDPRSRNFWERKTANLENTVQYAN